MYANDVLSVTQKIKEKDSLNEGKQMTIVTYYNSYNKKDESLQYPAVRLVQTVI